MTSESKAEKGTHTFTEKYKQRYCISQKSYPFILSYNPMIAKRAALKVAPFIFKKTVHFHVRICSDPDYFLCLKFKN